MKITSIRAVQPVDAASPPDWRTSIGQMLVAVDTDSGLTGYGVGGGGLAGVHVVRSVLAELLVGRDPAAVESLWEEMYRATLPFGQKGIAIMAISGVDLALWDLRGKARQQPVAALLGGRTGRPIPTYVTVWDDLPAAIDRGFQGFKLHVEGRGGGDGGRHVEQVVASVARARQLVGIEKQLMIDAWMRWDVPTTLAVDTQAAPFRLEWIEEPLPADDLAGYAELARRCRTPIAGGEHEFTARGFEPLVRQGLHQTLQPDVCWCGGMTELVKIYGLAERAGLRVCPHRGSEIWGLHAIAALDPRPLAESGRPWMSWVGGQPPIIDGSITLDDRPGFGVEIDEPAVGLR